jgi:urease accessory protein
VSAGALGDARLLRLLRLASPALPVGAYSYSQGLEWAIEAGTVRDERSALRWVEDTLVLGLGALEAPVWWRLHRAWVARDVGSARRWNGYFCAYRETRELRAETLQLGRSLSRLLVDLGELAPERRRDLLALEEPSFPAAFSFAVAAWGVPAEPGLLAYLYSWAENQVLACLKAVPLGQLAGQRMLSALEPHLCQVAQHAACVSDDALGSGTPALALASCAHETQYSRLFRS